MRVAVSGVGGAVGQSIMKALSVSTLPIEVCAIDIHPLSAGLFRAQRRMVLMKPEAPSGLEAWEHAMLEQKIEALIPGSDHDLLPLASVREDWARRDVCQILVSDLDLVMTCRDKALTCQALERAGLPTPKSAWDLSPEDAVSWSKFSGYPVVIKPRNGFGSRNFHLVQNDEELRFYFPRTPNPILQEYLSDSGNDEEYTCAVFVDREGSPVGTFMIRRELNSGATYRAEVGYWPEIHELLLAIGSTLRPRGVLNVQLRMTSRGPVPHELNIRCSGTTAIRAYFGFNEPEMLLRHYVLGEDICQPETRTGYVFRYWNEIFLGGVDAGELKQGFQNATQGRKGEILAWP